MRDIEERIKEHIYWDRWDEVDRLLEEFPEYKEKFGELYKRIVFLTGSRADFGKMKSIFKVIDNSKEFEAHIFITGMHTLSKFGKTHLEIKKEGLKNRYVYINQREGTEPDTILSNTVLGFGNYVKEIKPGMIVVHGDRIEAFAGAIVGSFNNIPTAHVEGGEISGTLDEIMRHAISKLSHVHFVSNETAKKRLIQMGEDEKRIFVIGSPDVDIMKSENLPSLDSVKKKYEINFDKYAILMYHPVTTELDSLEKNIKTVVSSLKKTDENYVVIYPNNDAGSDIVLDEIKELKDLSNFRVIPSMRFEYFLRLLKEAEFIIGNSSCGIMEAEVYGTPTIDIGSRQQNRGKLNKNIIHVGHNKKQIHKAVDKAKKQELEPISNFGEGNSAEKFYSIIKNKNFWDINIQKQFKDIDI